MFIQISLEGRVKGVSFFWSLLPIPLALSHQVFESGVSAKLAFDCGCSLDRHCVLPEETS